MKGIKGFIECTIVNTKEPIMLNIEHILSVYSPPTEPATLIRFRGSNIVYSVKETYSEVVAKIREAQME